MTVRELILTAAVVYQYYQISWSYNGDKDCFDYEDVYSCLKDIPHYVGSAQVSRWGIDGDVLWIECM